MTVNTYAQFVDDCLQIPGKFIQTCKGPPLICNGFSNFFAPTTI